MGLTHSPRIVTDGLVYHLDPASPKCYSTSGLKVDYCIVAGGGGGGGVIGGGGGAGGLVFGSASTTLGQSYSVVVGAGGAGGVGWNNVGQEGKPGTDSSVFSCVALGGGGGGPYGGATSTTQVNGGSGGGEGNFGSFGIASQPSASCTGFGNNGGNHAGSDNGGGGGGAGIIGSDAILDIRAGDGGQGKRYPYYGSTSIGESGWLAGGGGGGTRNGNGVAGIGGLGGGGNGTTTTVTAQAGTANTGGGGGGGGYSGGTSSTVGGAGGSGVVIISYSGPQRATGGDSVYNINGRTIHVFDNSGSFVVGGVAGDLSNNNYSSTLVNGTSFSPDNQGVFVFDGVNDYIQTDFGNGRNPATNPVSYSMWIQKTGSGDRMYMFQGNWGANARAYFGIIGGTWGAGVYTTGWSAGQGSTASLNTWYHVTIVFTGSAMQLYVNGSLDFQVSYSSYSFNQSLQIGGETYQGSYYWPGEIADFKIYNRALTVQELRQNFQATRGRYGV